MVRTEGSDTPSPPFTVSLTVKRPFFDGVPKFCRGFKNTFTGTTCHTEPCWKGITISFLIFFFNFEPGIEAIGLMDSSKFYWGTLVPSWYDWDLDVCPAQRWWGIGFCWQLVLHLEVIDAHIRAQAGCRSWLVIAITFRRCCEQDGPVIGCPEPGCPWGRATIGTSLGRLALEHQ